MDIGGTALGGLLDFIKGFFGAIPFAYAFRLFHDVLLVLDVALFATLLYTLAELRPYKAKFYKNPRKALTKEQKKIPTLHDVGLTKRWKEILEKAEAAPPQSYTLAIIEADSFVDDILKKMGYPGDHMADRLLRIDTGDLQSLDGLWTAHRARNNLVHTPGYVMNERDAKKYLKDYEAFLREIEVLE